MQAVILAAGKGSRMRPLTDTTPKALIRIGDKTIIGRILETLAAVGVHRVAVVTGYRGDEIREHLQQLHPGFDFRFIHNERFHETNNIHSTALAFQQIDLDDDVLLIESDLVAEPAVFERIVRSPHPNVALVDHWRTGLDGTVVTVTHEGITSVIPPHLQGADFSFADKFKTLNVYKFDRDFCRDTFRPLLGFYASSIDHNAYYELVLGILIYLKKVTMQAEVVHGLLWTEVDDANDLRGAEFIVGADARRRILEHDMGGYWAYDIVDFCFIRNVHFPTPAILAELRTNLGELLGSYGSRQQVVDTKMANFLLCRSDRVLTLNGASQLFPFLAEYLRGRDVLLPRPTFGEYARAFPDARFYADTELGDTSGLESSARDVVVVVNPNNPTGTVVPTERIHAFAAAHPHLLVLVDESFVAFAGMPSMVSLLECQPLQNVVVLASLGKVLGVPGVRLGYLYTCDAALRTRARDWLPIWNINSVAENLLEIVLKHRPQLEASIEATVRDRNKMASDLERVPGGVTVHPSGGNFLLVTLSRPAEQAAALVDALLCEHRIFVKNVSDRVGDGHTHLRLAVRGSLDNQTLCAALTQVVST